MDENSAERLGDSSQAHTALDEVKGVESRKLKLVRHQRCFMRGHWQ